MTGVLVTIAIRDLAGPAARATTLAALARHTPESHEVVLLTDAPADLPSGLTARALAAPAEGGAPAALNRLLVDSAAPYLLLLESGAIVTAGWLGRLLAPFDDPAVGLCGPSTNIAWNEQQVLPRPGGADWDVARIDAFAAQIAARYGDLRRPLDTLHSLGDFCYLFRRAVAERLGGFDEAYGAGPCWEIDFSTRAARAGFGALWVAAAYIHRRPPAPAAAAAQRRLFTANKQLYQDRFCGLRLRGQRADYEPHCRGEACEHFAPPDLIRLRVDRPTANDQRPTTTDHRPGTGTIERAPSDHHGERPTIDHRPGTGTIERAPSDHHGERQTNAVSFAAAVPERVEGPGMRPTTDEPEGWSGSGSPVHLVTLSPCHPLISCIMPTRDRRAFIPQAITLFQRQDYPARELIILDDGDDSVADLIPDDPRVRYVRLDRRMILGAKRNLACELARGALIAHWDDDDWYAPERLSRQCAPLLAGGADLTGLSTGCFLDLDEWRAWICSPELHRRLFTGDVHGGTLVYARWVWEQLARYPEIAVAEDALFLRAALRRGARLQRLPGEGSFVYLRHGANAWRFTPGSYLDPAGWQLADPARFLPPNELPFYQRLSPRAPAAASTDLPLVSCIMPTCNRRAYVPLAIGYFQRQDYPARELIILDDGDDSVADLIPDDPRVRYVRLDRRMILGAKRNLACELARGALVMHWDDDDWCAPQRISYQVGVLTEHRADLCGAGRQIYYSPQIDRAWLYEYPPALRRWLAGNTLCYRRAFWERNRFPEVAVGEDTRFAWSPQATNAVVTHDHRFYVGIIHEANTSRKNVAGTYWRSLPPQEVHQLLGEDLSYYRIQVASKTERDQADVASPAVVLGGRI